jgi:ankyrin repeat protein
MCHLIDTQQVYANSNNNKPLLRASRYGFLEIVRELIARGADPSICDYLPLR